MASYVPVEPDVVVDANGEWEPLFKVLACPFLLIRYADARPQRPDHILTVYRPMVSNKEFIAKNVREDSNELEILKLLDTFPLKSDHVISLIDSFHGWAILPKMVSSRITSSSLLTYLKARFPKSAWALSGALRIFTSTI